jgi:hypothetical protein
MRHCMKFPMPWLAAILVAALGPQAANATWKTNSTTDPLTKEKHPYMSSAGQGAIRRFGHSVTSRLVVYCVPLPNQGVPFPSVDLWFSEKVAVGDLKARFRFDTGLVHVGEMESDSGNQFSLLRGLVGSEFNLYWDEFKTSNKLRIQVGLPWAGDTVIEFDTSGASEALDKIPCEER